MKQIILPLAAAMLTACASQKSKTVDANTSATTLVEQNDKKMDNNYNETDIANAEKLNSFGLKIFERLNATAGNESLICSPLGVAYVLAMLDNGAEGAGKQEIEAALGLDDQNINELSRKMIAHSEQQKKSATFSIANYLALNKDFSLKTKFKENMYTYYNAGVDNLDFASPSALQTINSWCSKNTGGMIPKFLDSTNPNAKAYVLNALYFNGEWQEKFSARNTRPEDFTSADGTKRKEKMMHQNTEFQYLDNDTLQILRLPYGMGSYEMIVALPRQGKSIDDAISYLKNVSLRKINRQTKKYEVNTYLPNFTSENKFDLNATLQALGIRAVYNDGSALRGISKQGVVVSQVMQKAKIEVTEEGTKAAAVTGAMLLTSAMPQPVPTATFRADHPFVYMIVDKPTGAVLFVGAYK